MVTFSAASDTARLQLCALFSNTADGVRTAAFPLMVAQLAGSPLMVGTVAAAGTLPWLLCTLFVGRYIDTKGAAKVFRATQLVRVAAMALALLALAGGNSAVLLITVAFALGVLEVFSNTAESTLLPELTGTAGLVSANARLNFIEVVMHHFIGVALGAVLFKLDQRAPLLVIAVAYAIAAWYGCQIRPQRSTTGAAAPDREASLFDGVHYVCKNKVLLSLALITGMTNFAMAGFFGVLVLFVRDGLRASEFYFALTFVLVSIGSVCGLILVKPIRDRISEATTLRASIVLVAFAIGLTAMTRNAWTTGIAMWCLGISVSLWGTLAVSYRQEVVPPALLGRVNAFYRLIAYGTAPLGSLAAGALAGYASFGSIYGMLSIVVLVCCAGFPYISQRRLDGMRPLSAP